ncbi:MAG: molecular chaperone GrpE [Actinomycetota bacterium]|nr:molecular chaperone GrpE [Actinomycetota bacterium]
MSDPGQPADEGVVGPGDDVIDVAEVADAPPTFEDIVGDLERVTAERDEYLRLAQSKQAELENFRKRVMKQQADEVARASGRLVDALLPVLDAFDYAAAHGNGALEPMRDQLLGALEKEGLVRIDSTGEVFDPTLHEAVAHEPADDGVEPVVTDTMRAGYLWQGQLLRPAMVRVKG